MLVKGTKTTTENVTIDARPNEVAKALRKHVYTKVFGTQQYLFLSKKNQVMHYDDLKVFLTEPTEKEITVLKAFETISKYL